MKRIKILSIAFIFCLWINMMFPIIANNVYAKNDVTLDFKNAQLFNGTVVWGDVSISLNKKDAGESNTYKKVDILTSNISIDLEESNYYLKIENPKNENIKLMINGNAQTIPGDNYFGLHSNEFSGVLNIEIEKNSAPPAGQETETKENITVDAISKNGSIANVEINNVGFNDGKETTKINATKEVTKKSQDEIKITVEFGKTISSITINDIPMDITGVTDMATYIVNHEKNYKIEIVCGETNKNINMPISWDYTGKTFGKDSLVQYGDIEILAVKLEDGTTLTTKQMQEYVEEDRGFGIQKYPKYEEAYLEKTETTGEVRIKAGLEVTIKLTPKYGYQLTSTSLNGTKIEAVNDKQSTFTFKMPETPLHLSALFTKVDDKVNTKSEKVQSGDIKINNNEIDTGSVVLSVEDIKLNEEQILSFEKAAKGYNISSYLNINLDQVLYKGNENSVWKNELKELNNPATITLKLEEGVNGEELVIVHEKHDGTFEVIPTTYDKSTNVITFATSSFSNYAIASKEESKIIENNSNSPKTGDNIIPYFFAFTVALVGIFTLIAVNVKNKKVKKH